jgi:hypothetical protein
MTEDKSAIQQSDSTGDPRVDDILRGTLKVFLAAFPPNRIQAAYLVGSYADGSAVPLSDIDLRLVFAGDFLDLEEEQRFLVVRQYCRDLSPIPLDCPPLSEQRLLRDPAWSHEAISIKCASRHLYGEDLRPRLVLPDLETYTRQVERATLYFFARVHRIEMVVYPLGYPDPDGEFYGYVDSGRSAHDAPIDPDFASTKLLVHFVGFAATGLLARQAGRLVVKKGDWLEAYQDAIHDEWTPYLERLYHLCRQEWGYRVPLDAADRLALRKLCAQALEFENHYLLSAMALE